MPIRKSQGRKVTVKRRGHRPKGRTTQRKKVPEKDLKRREEQVKYNFDEMDDIDMSDFTITKDDVEKFYEMWEEVEDMALDEIGKSYPDGIAEQSVKLQHGTRYMLVRNDYEDAYPMGIEDRGQKLREHSRELEERVEKKQREILKGIFEREEPKLNILFNREKVDLSDDLVGSYVRHGAGNGTRISKVVYVDDRIVVLDAERPELKGGVRFLERHVPDRTKRPRNGVPYKIAGQDLETLEDLWGEQRHYLTKSKYRKRYPHIVDKIQREGGIEGEL